MPQTSKTTLVQSRISKELKAEAEEILEEMGLTLGDFIRISLKQIVNNPQMVLQSKTKSEYFTPQERDQIVKAIQRDKKGEPGYTVVKNESELDVFLAELNS